MVWADQICINQDDSDERAEQVKFMNSIYHHANRVLVWLGQDEDDEAEKAFVLVNSLAEMLKDTAQLEKFTKDYTIDKLKLSSKESWAPMKYLTRLPWVRESWQSISLA
jgi:hypothetical protein